MALTQFETDDDFRTPLKVMLLKVLPILDSMKDDNTDNNFVGSIKEKWVNLLTLTDSMDGMCWYLISLWNHWIWKRRAFLCSSMKWEPHFILEQRKSLRIRLYPRHKYLYLYTYPYTDTILYTIYAISVSLYYWSYYCTLLYITYHITASVYDAVSVSVYCVPVTDTDISVSVVLL